MTRRHKKSGYMERPHSGGSKHIGYGKLASDIKKSERKAHPNYSQEHIDHVAHATAGEIANKRRGF